MSERKIDQFFTRTPSHTPKRPRSSSSPLLTDVAGMDHEKVGELTQAQLMSGLSSLLDDKLSKLATKDDLLSLSMKVGTLEEENRLLREEVSCLREQGQLVMGKVVDLESRARRNNLIFKGLKVPPKASDYSHIVWTFCREVLGCREGLWVNRAHPLGKDRSTLIAHLPDDGDIQYIMSRVKTLKGTGYVVHRDFPREIRVKRAILAKVRAEVERVSGKKRMPLFHDHLTIEGSRFTWEGGYLRAGPVDGGSKLKEITGHDFSEFLVSLQLGDGARGGDENSIPLAAASTGGSGNGSIINNRP